MSSYENTIFKRKRETNRKQCARSITVESRGIAHRCLAHRYFAHKGQKSLANKMSDMQLTLLSDSYNQILLGAFDNDSFHEVKMYSAL